MIDTLGRMLYPRVHGRARRRKMRALGLGILLGTLVSCLVGGLLWYLNRPIVERGTIPARHQGAGPLVNPK